MTVFNVPDPIPTITAALAMAGPNDTIRIAPGTFSEALVIGAGKAGIRIIGSGVNKTILEGNNALNTAFDITGSQLVTIECLTVQNYTNDGIEINTNSNILRNLLVIGNGAEGVHVTAGTHNLVMDVESSGNSSDGIDLDTNFNYCINCIVKDNGIDGISITADCNFICNNLIQGNGDGIFTTSAATDNLFINNCLISNTDSGLDAEGDGNLIYCNQALGNTNFGFEIEENNLILGNKAAKNGADGIMTADFSSGTDNRILKNKIFQNMLNGINITGMDSIIDNNCVVDNTQAGILLSTTSDNNGVRSNCLEGNNPDIQNNGGPGNVIDENKCETSVPDGLCEDCGFNSIKTKGRFFPPHLR
ncbi:nitrous oxide reductase family maturation protein NosD [Chengkuizengella sp. SCS-71B]|uniref:right-handed parallel beta-helix repeat-containing protein n=1 Tax=Chengkuizengella sp. SCS-71B TaxID=3115290 RepID=UPI0032C2157F